MITKSILNAIFSGHIINSEVLIVLYMLLELMLEDVVLK